MSSTNINKENIKQSSYLRLTLIPIGQPVATDINPIARLNFGVDIYNYDINRIGEIYLMNVFTICPLSWLYDRLIYFYVLFLITVTCKSEVQRSWIMILIYLAIYIFLLIGPIISAFTMAISGLFFVYYCIGVVVYIINKCRLRGHNYTQNMVYFASSPPFSGQNQFYEIQAQFVKEYYYKNSKQQIYLEILKSGRDTFMAYRDQFVSSNFEYIMSCKEIAFHIIFLLISIFGLVISVSIFPGAYGKK